MTIERIKELKRLYHSAENHFLTCDEEMVDFWFEEMYKIGEHLRDAEDEYERQMEVV